MNLGIVLFVFTVGFIIRNGFEMNLGMALVIFIVGFILGGNVGVLVIRRLGPEKFLTPDEWNQIFEKMRKRIEQENKDK
jgi:membrane protein DedA with SNARE-associated domain